MQFLIGTNQRAMAICVARDAQAEVEDGIIGRVVTTDRKCVDSLQSKAVYPDSENTFDRASQSKGIFAMMKARPNNFTSCEPITHAKNQQSFCNIFAGRKPREKEKSMSRTGSSPDDAAAPIPLMHFRTDDLPDTEAFDQWRELVAPLFHVERSRFTGVLPRGNRSVFMVGEIMVSRNTFNAQHLSRDQALIAATPDHLIMQYYRSGGFRGVVAGQPVCIKRGEVAIADLGQTAEADAATSNTVGLSVPRSLLDGIDPMALRLQLDAPQNRLLGSYMAGLPQRLKRVSVNDCHAVEAGIIALLRGVFSKGSIRDGSDKTASVEGSLDHVLEVIEANPGEHELSPAYLAHRVGVSRAKLYRLFAPMGGIMNYVHERRLVAVRDALSDSLEKRTLAELAVAYGFKSQALVSRGFREVYGMTPRDWRHENTERDLESRERSPDPVQFLWQQLGRPKRSS